MAFFSPQTQFREIAIVPQHTVLLFVDVQNYNCHRGGMLFKTLTSQGQQNVGP
jgi:nicotinamidase-related amidase